MALTCDLTQCCTVEGRRSSVRKPSDCLWGPVVYILVTRHFDISLGHCIYRLCCLFSITYVKINYLQINHKTRTKSNRTLDSPNAFQSRYSVTFSQPYCNSHLQAHRQYWQQCNYCTQRKNSHCFALSSTSRRHMGNGGLAPHILNLGTGLRATMNFTFRYAITTGGYHTRSGTISSLCWEPNHNPRCPASCDTVLLIVFWGGNQEKNSNQNWCCPEHK